MQNRVITSIAVALGLGIFGAFIAGAAPSKRESAAAGAAAQAPCDRACLNGFVDQYLAALVAHDPSKLPHSPMVKYTENNVVLQLGDGLWATTDRIGSYKIYIDDPAAGEVGYFGVVYEDGNPGIFGTRLKIVDRKVTQIETIVARRESANSTFPNPQGLKEKPIFYEDLPPAERLPRARMIAIANSYFDTIQENTGKIYAPFDANCARVENGVQTANNPNATGVAKMGCEAQLKTGLLRFVTRCRDRRFVVVDQQKGLVLVSAFFDHAGVLRTMKLTDGSTYHVKMPFDMPYSFVMFELF